jgi:hypothetical protein
MAGIENVVVVRFVAPCRAYQSPNGLKEKLQRVVEGQRRGAPRAALYRTRKACETLHSRLFSFR